MKTANRKRLLRRCLRIFLILFILMNVVAAFHAYKFTHFITSETAKTGDPVKLNTAQKFKTLIFGVNNPRPTNKLFPSRKFETIKLESNKSIECWLIPQQGARGTVVIFHGYGGDKS
jgi:uncharacterized protein YhhL (DUF1145 family)